VICLEGLLIRVKTATDRLQALAKGRHRRLVRFFRKFPEKFTVYTDRSCDARFFLDTDVAWLCVSSGRHRYVTQSTEQTKINSPPGDADAPISPKISRHVLCNAASAYQLTHHVLIFVKTVPGLTKKEPQAIPILGHSRCIVLYWCVRSAGIKTCHWLTSKIKSP